MSDARGSEPLEAPPSSRRANLDPDVTVARGAARDGVGSVHNLGHLLRSMRVGARPLAQAIVEVRDGCGALRAAFVALRAVVRDRQPLCANDAADALFEGALANIDALAATLDHADRAATDARSRLAVEVAVRRAGTELDGVLCLSDLLVAARAPCPVPLELDDVLRLHLCGPRTVSAQVTLTLEPGDYSFNGDPVVASLLVEVALASVARRRSRTLRIAPTRAPHGRVWLTIRADESPTAVGAPGALTVTLGEPVATALDVASAVARSLGANIEIEVDRHTARVLL